nr:hypothetical protein CFP56_47300 [Quercus suber]
MRLLFPTFYDKVMILQPLFLHRRETQPLVEEVISSNDEVEAQFEEVEEETEEENTKSLICDEDFEIFYHQDVTEDVASTSRPATSVISEDQEATESPEAMVIEKRLPDLLSILESHIEDVTLEVPIMPRPPSSIPPPPTQFDLADKKWKRDKKGEKVPSRKGKSKKKLLLNKLRLPKLLGPNKGAKERLQR